MKSAALSVLIVCGLCAGAGAGTFDCVIEPSRVVKVSAGSAGLLASVKVEVGDWVKKGQLLAELESQIDEPALEVAKLRAADEFNTKGLKLERDFLRRKLARLTTLNQSSLVSDETREETEASLAKLEAAIEQSELAHRIALAELSRAQAVLDQRRVFSPIDGVIVERHLSEGEFLAEQDYVVVISQLDPLNIRAFLPVDAVDLVDLGQTATVEPEPPVSGRYAAQIVAIDRVFDVASGTFGIVLQLTNDGGALPAGLKCQLTLN